MYNDILAARHILVIPHQNPDGDAIGSCSAFLEFLSLLGKSSAAFCATEMAPRLAFLPHADAIGPDERRWEHPELDLVVVFDSGDLGYAGVAHHIARLPRRPRIFSIDHHITNERYGDLNFVDHTASSTAEMLYRFFSINGVAITPRMATALLTGLLTDTDSFTNGATTASALSAGRDLLMRGAHLSSIVASVFRDKTIPTLKLWGIALSRLEKHPELDMAHTYVTREDIASAGADHTDVEGIANYMNVIGETDISLMMRELPDGSCKGSFRTTHDKTDVSAIAKKLGGGGHRKAAGFTVPGPMRDAIDRVIQTMYTHRI